MASKLNPGADATLVNVAYRAAMADTPADYSKTFERMADSYEKTMEASSDMWGNIAKLGASIGGEMMKNAQELTDAVAKGATLNPEDTRLFYDEIYGVKDELKALGPLSMFGDRETRLKRAELKAKQQGLFADIDNAVANLKVGADAVAAGTLDDNLLGLKDKETINAIIKSNLKDKVTGEGNIAKLSRNEKGELMYTLYKENGGLADNPDGSDEPVTMTLKQFNESIATNVKDGGAMTTAFGSLTEQEANAGNKALNGTYDPERQQMTLNKLDALLGDKPVNLKRAMRTPIGYSNTSLYDDLTSKGALSAELYGMLNNVSGNQKGELTGGVVDGIEDVDGSGGISANEINYDVLVGNITGLKDAEVSKEFFKQYAVKEMEAAYKYGYSKKPPVPGSGTDGIKTGTNPYGLSLSKKGKYGLGLPSKGTSYVPQYDAAYVTNKIDSLKNGSEISFQGDNYTFREVDGVTQWWKNYGYGDDYGKKVEGVGVGTPIGTAKDMARDVFYVVDDPIFGNIVTEREQEVPDDKTGLLPSDNQFADRQSVAEGRGQAAVVPTDFVDAFKKDFQSDLAVVKYLKNMNVPGLVVGTYQGNPDYNYPNNDNRKLVTASDTGYDDIIATLNGKTKLFTTDPSFSDDTEGAQEIWNWLYENFSGTQASANNDYYNLIDNK